MARLTRTQKYADLRDQISHDRETSLETQDLNQYQNKLNSFENFNNSQSSSALNSEYQQTRSFEKATREYEEQHKQAMEQAYQNEQAFKKAQEESMKSLDDILSSMMNVGVQKEEPSPVEVQVEETKRDTQDLMSTMQIVSSEVDSLSNIIDNTENEYPQTELPNTNFEPTLLNDAVKTAPQNIVNNQTVNNNFVNRTITEVNDFNRNAGRATLEALSNDLINEVRHSDYRFNNGEDDEFSNTVSLEIDKVLSEIKNSNTQNIQKVQEPVVNARPVEQVQPKTLEETFEHPVLAKTQEQAPVEIKNIDETFNTKAVNDSNVLDDTIPFVVNKNDVEDDEYYDDDDEEAPSKVLNVILGILIFVLIAVLGIIVYYILVAKGILG